MQRDFAQAITPVFNTSLRWLERISQPDRPVMRMDEIKDAQANIKSRVNAARKKIEPRNRNVWQLVHFAIVAWLDEQCCSLNWEGKQWWQNNSLEVSYFGTKFAHEAFYEKAEEARADRNAIEIYFLCVILGFRGVYMDLRSNDPELVENATDFVAKLNLPGDLREWLRRAATLIPLGESFDRLHVVDREGSGAFPLAATGSFISSLLFTLIAIGALAAYFIVLFKSS